MLSNINNIPDWQNLNILSKNRLPARTSFIPYESYEQCSVSEGLIEKRHISTRFILLNGDWEFKYYNSVFDVPEDITTKKYKDNTPWDIIPVPSCWQTLGYEKPHYINFQFPIPAIPPKVPNDNPVGVYRRYFTLPCTFKNLNTIIHFAGVSSAFHLYINGEEVGYSQGSHLPAEFDITPYLVNGENELTVLVYKWCDGTYLECQDMFRHNGIFRDVYLLANHNSNINDFCFSTSLIKDNTFEAKLNLLCQLENESTIEVKIKDINNNIIAESIIKTKDNHNTIIWQIENPQLWTAETPNLYRLFISLLSDEGNEFVCSLVGFRYITIENSIFKLNNTPIKIKGVNRHDSHPNLGYVTPPEDMLKDIKLMKSLNVNAVRTSHYPNDPLWLQYCDIYGLYVIDETDLECHGACQMDEGFNYFSNNPDWEKAFIDRMERMVLRDRNHPSIIMWSLGNESGIGKNHDKMAEKAKELAPWCPIHYEGAIASDKKGYDVVSMMYPTIDQLLEHGKNEAEDNRPFFMCEYAHAMGLGPGSFKEYWELIDKYHRLMGGCVWEWCDHAIEHKQSDGSITYTYGGDHGEWPHDGNFCVDGLVFPDRRLHTGALEMKHFYRPIRFIGVNIKEGIVKIENHLNFLSTKDFKIIWSVLKNGNKIYNEILDIKPIKANEHLEIKINHQKLNLTQDGSIYHLQLTAFDTRDTIYNDGERDCGSNQFELPITSSINSKVNEFKILTFDNDFQSTVRGDNFEIIFCKRNGTIKSLQFNEKEYLCVNPQNKGNGGFNKGFAGPRPNIWRAPTDNDMYQKSEWQRLRYDHMWHYIDETTFDVINNQARFTVLGTMGAPSHSPCFSTKTTYAVNNEGKINIETSITPLKNDLVHLPRFGMLFELDNNFDKIKWFGHGLHQNYPDYNESALLGYYEKTVSQMHEPYIRPQESGNRKVYFAAILDDNDNGLLISGDPMINFSAHHYSFEALMEADHAEKLKIQDTTQVSVDGFMCGLGNQSCGFPPLEQYRIIPNKALNFTFSIYPFSEDVISPEQLWLKSKEVQY